MKMKISTFVINLCMLAAVATAEGQTSGIDKKNMDFSVKPGTDFFEYCCGGWMKAHPLTAEYSSYGVTQELAETNRKQIRALIEGFASKPQQKGSLEQKIGSLYNLAMDSVRLNREGWEPLKPVLEKVKSIRNLKEYEIVMGQLEKKGINASMFDMGVDADIHNASMNLVSISQGGLTMGERDYYLKDDTATVKVRNAFKNYVVKLLEMVGNDQASAQKKMETVLNLETRIAKASYSAEKLRDVEGNYHKMSYSQLVNDYPGIDWGNILLCSGFPAVSEVSVGQPEPIHEVENILKETPIEDLKAFAEYKVTADAANSLDDGFRKISFEFTKAMTGAM